MAEEGLKDYHHLFSFSPLQASLRRVTAALLIERFAAMCLYNPLFHPALTLLDWLQAFQQCKSGSGQTKNEYKINPKAILKQVSGTNGQMRAQKLGLQLLMPQRRMKKAALAVGREYGIFHFDPPPECRGSSDSYNQPLCAGERQWMRLSTAYISQLCWIRQ